MSTNSYAPSSPAAAGQVHTELEYAGFWIRTAATMIDAVFLIGVTFPILYAIYGPGYFAMNAGWLGLAGTADLLISCVAPAICTVLFWLARQGTPGKILLFLRVVDAQTGKTLSFRQAVGRYLAYYVSLVPFCLGAIWVGVDARKQGWHDKLAGSVVVRDGASKSRAAVFPGES